MLLLALALVFTITYGSSQETCGGLKKELDDLSRYQQSVNSDLFSQIRDLKTTNNALQDELSLFKSEVKPGKYYMFSKHGCIDDIIDLTCETGSTLLLTSADLGLYEYACGLGECCPPHPGDDCTETLEQNSHKSWPVRGKLLPSTTTMGLYEHGCGVGECCPPHPGDDCTETLEQNSATDWFALKSLCDGEESCSYQYQGFDFVTNCVSLAQADYINIMYSCVPGSPSNSVGFTVYNNRWRSYDAFELIVYDVVASNIGGHYNMDQHLFICPYSGLYMFFLNCQTDYDSGHSFRISLHKDGESVINCDCDNDNNADITGSNMAVVFCEAGSKVWVQSRHDSEQSGSHLTLNSFSGFLINLENSPSYLI